MRKGLTALASFLLVASTFVAPAQASAASPCFADIPDSAWTDGVPSDVSKNLNYEIAQRIEDPLFDFYDNWQSRLKLIVISKYDIDINYRNLYYVIGGNSYKIKYTYSGTSCTTRNIEVLKSFTDKPKFLPYSDVEIITNSISKDFLDSQEKAKIISNLKKYLDGKTISIPVSSSWTSSGNWWFSKRIMAQYNWQYIGEQLNKLSGPNPNGTASFTMYFKPDPSCAVYGQRSGVWNLPKQFKLSGQIVTSSWPAALKFTKKSSQPCKVSFFLEVLPYGFSADSISKYLGPKSDNGLPLSVGFEFASGYLKAVR
jgi:hypothetical protein